MLSRATAGTARGEDRHRAARLGGRGAAGDDASWSSRNSAISCSRCRSRQALLSEYREAPSALNTESCAPSRTPSPSPRRSAIIARSIVPIDAHRAAADRRSATAGWWPPTSSRRRMCRPSRAPAWMATRWSPRTPSAPAAANPKTLRDCRAAVYRRGAARSAVGRGTCVEIATGAPMPERRRRGGEVEETERGGPSAVRILTPGLPAAERRPPGRRHCPPGRRCCARATCSTAGRIGALAALGLADVEVYRRPSVAVLSTGNEIVGAGPAAGARADLRHQPLHAQHRHRAARRPADAVRDGAATPSRRSTRRSPRAWRAT